MPKPKEAKDYAIEAARKRLAMRECARCQARVWGGFCDYSWVFMDPINLTPEQEAWCMLNGVETWEVRWVGTEWSVDYRMLFHVKLEKETGTRHTVFPSHKCHIVWNTLEGEG